MMASPIMVAIDDRAGRPSVKLSFRMFAGRRHKRCHWAGLRQAPLAALE
jgi:hypothetical protein